MSPPSTAAAAPSRRRIAASSWRLPCLVLLLAITLPAVTTLNLHENPLDDPLGMPAFDLDLFASAVTADQIKSVPKDEILVSPSGISFYCPRPAYDPASPHTPATAATSDPRTQEQVIADAMRLLKPLAKQPCLSIEQGWWRYDYCHERRVSQIHEFGEKVPPAKYVLGQYARGEDKPELHVKAGKRYVSVRYRGGDVCDETGRPRTVEIQYHCSESATTDRLSLVQETALCNYHVTLFSPRLCADPAMAKPKSSLVHTQSCHLVVDNKESIGIWAREPRAYLQHMKLGVLGADAFLPRSVLLPPRGSSLDRAKARVKASAAAAAAGAVDTPPGLTPRKLTGERGEGTKRMGAPATTSADAQESTSPPAAKHKRVVKGGEEQPPALSDMLVEIAESLIRKYKDQSSEPDKRKVPAAVAQGEDEAPQLYIVTEDGVVPLDSWKGDEDREEGAEAAGDGVGVTGKDSEGEDVDGLEPESPLLFGEVPI
ncbi:hypothetical protein BCR44DRAFT_1483191 [Catenaria anguillulae PL171]|uniref:Protein OS-9 homolog n=1 Tax=Catenaria anguillulae PL171 TaxID=765915 RepID=A0A1Y2I0I8_9FUNG|nr:hypothetical protein BCR44DRAFT_1483191 [Catenaria anguillulae PL171]